jgi:hypothetical protein
MVKNMKNNLLGTQKKQSQFQKCEILKLWKLKVFKHLEFQNLKNVLPHIKCGKFYMMYWTKL